MEVDIREFENYFILDLPEDTLGGSLGSNIEELVTILIENHVEEILVNCEKIKDIDHLGLGALLAIQKICMINGATVKVFNLQPIVEDKIFQTRLNRLIKVFNNEKEALSTFKAGIKGNLRLVNI